MECIPTHRRLASQRACFFSPVQSVSYRRSKLEGDSGLIAACEPFSRHVKSTSYKSLRMCQCSFSLSINERRHVRPLKMSSKVKMMEKICFCLLCLSLSKVLIGAAYQFWFFRNGCHLFRLDERIEVYWWWQRLLFETVATSLVRAVHLKLSVEVQQSMSLNGVFLVGLYVLCRVTTALQHRPIAT